MANRRREVLHAIASVYALASFAFTFLVLGMALADGFILGSIKVLEWWSGQSIVAGLVWALFSLILFPGTLALFIVMLWKLKKELEEIVERVLAYLAIRWLRIPTTPNQHGRN